MINPTVYADLIDEATYFGIQRLRNEVLKMPVTERSAPTILKTVEFLANRSLGPVVQRVEAKFAHLNLDRPTAHSLKPEDTVGRIEELKAKLLGRDAGK